MSGKRPKTQRKQLLLAFAEEGRGDTPVTDAKGTEPLVAKPARESPAEEERLMGAGRRVGMSDGRGNAAGRSSFSAVE
jgi:hypothetical protein